MRVTVSLGTILDPAARRAVSTAALGPLLRRCGVQMAVSSRSDIAVQLVDDVQIRELNVRFAGVDKPTDVLAFPGESDGHIGDIALSVERALAQADDGVAELRLLAVHGFLHCLGYDHAVPSDAAAMTMKTKELLPDQQVPDL